MGSRKVTIKSLQPLTRQKGVNYFRTTLQIGLNWSHLVVDKRRYVETHPQVPGNLSFRSTETWKKYLRHKRVANGYRTDLGSNRGLGEVRKGKDTVAHPAYEVVGIKHKKGVLAVKKIWFLGVLIGLILASCSAPGTSVFDQTATPALPPMETSTSSTNALETPQTPAPSPGQSSSIGYSSVAEALADLKSRNDVIVEVSQGWTTITEADGLTIWSFTPANHPAYPALAKRVLFRDQEGWKIKMDILCEADNAACDQFARDFETLNEQMRQYIEQQRP